MPMQLGHLMALQNVFLLLRKYKLSGTIPTELGLLSSLRTLLLGQVRLTVSVPSEVCEQFEPSSDTLVVDCPEVRFDCNCTCVDDV
jgi:hypothetical protein